MFIFCSISVLAVEGNNNTALAVISEQSLRQAKCGFCHHFQNTIIYNIQCFSVFGIGIVRFENSLCISEGLWGTCYRRSQCTSINGISSGSCANGIGVCCICTQMICKIQI